MGMTIEETISDLTELKICGVMPFSKGTLSGGDYKVITNECIDVAIDTISKYQKVEEAYRNYMKDIVTNIYADRKFINALKEILENDN